MTSNRDVGRNENEGQDCDHDSSMGSYAGQLNMSSPENRGTITRAVGRQVANIGSSSRGLGNQGKKRDRELIQPSLGQSSFWQLTSSRIYSKSLLTCHRCGQVGHRRFQCTQTPRCNARAVEVKQPATSTLARAHESQGRKRARESFQASQGRSNFRAPTSSKFEENLSRPTVIKTCFWCRQPGHIRSSCPQHKTLPSPQSFSPGACFGCGGLGHFKRFCPNQRGMRSKSSSMQQPSAGQSLSLPPPPPFTAQIPDMSV